MPNVGENVKQVEVVYSQWDCKMLIHFERQFDGFKRS